MSIYQAPPLGKAGSQEVEVEYDGDQRTTRSMEMRAEMGWRRMVRVRRMGRGGGCAAVQGGSGDEQCRKNLSERVDKNHQYNTLRILKLKALLCQQRR
jgi:hypothetical protein